MGRGAGSGWRFSADFWWRAVSRLACLVASRAVLTWRAGRWGLILPASPTGPPPCPPAIPSRHAALRVGCAGQQMVDPAFGASFARVLFQGVSRPVSACSVRRTAHPERAQRNNGHPLFGRIASNATPPRPTANQGHIRRITAAVVKMRTAALAPACPPRPITDMNPEQTLQSTEELAAILMQQNRMFQMASPPKLHLAA